MKVDDDYRSLVLEEIRQIIRDARVTEMLGLDPGPPAANAPSMTDDVTSLKIEASEARTEVKLAQAVTDTRLAFAEFKAELSNINTRLEGIERASAGVKTTIIITAIALAGALVAILTYGQAWFGIGVSTRDVVKSAVSEYVQQHPPSQPSR